MSKVDIQLLKEMHEKNPRIFSRVHGLNKDDIPLLEKRYQKSNRVIFLSAFLIPVAIICFIVIVGSLPPRSGEFVRVIEKVNASKNDGKALSALSRLNIDIRSKSWQGATPLIYFSIAGDIDAVRLLLKLGADTTIKNDYGRTAADTARIEGHDEVYFLLTGSHIFDSIEENDPRVNQ